MQKTRTALTPGLIAIVGFLTVCPVVMLILGSFSEGLGAFGTFTLDEVRHRPTPTRPLPRSSSAR